MANCAAPQYNQEETDPAEKDLCSGWSNHESQRVVYNQECPYCQPNAA